MMIKLIDICIFVGKSPCPWIKDDKTKRRQEKFSEPFVIKEKSICYCPNAKKLYETKLIVNGSISCYANEEKAV